MTNPTPHGQVPEALIDLIDTYAETRHRYGRIYNPKTEAARKAVIEALSEVQALSAGPGPVSDTQHSQFLSDVLTAAGLITHGKRCKALGERLSDMVMRLRTAPQPAPGVGNSGFDHQTAADFLNGKTVSDEAVRKFVAASRWAHDERAALSATLLAMHGVLTSREAEIALLKKALLEAEAAPQQEAQAPAFWMNEKGHTWSHSDWKQFPKHRAKYPIPLYAHRPPPLPAPDCHHRPPCDECAALAAQGGSK